MKTGILTTKTIASEDIKDTKSIMGMSSKGMEMATFYLRDKIYSDKILAVVREYICNAWDEHVKYDITRPVDVKMVAHDNQHIWSVRDYAMGLDEHDIRNVFGMYFESTKSNTNDVIGGFGIGGKAAFSYIDTFYVVSYHNGVKTNYVCTLGSGTKGIPVGEIYKISEEPTTESGIEISLEITGYSNVDSFDEKTRKFVSFFDPKAKVEFRDSSNRLITPVAPVISKPMGDFIINKYEDVPHYRGSGQQFFIRMGGVVYPHNFRSKSRSFSGNVIIDVPIGRLSIPISRESIETTPLNTKVIEEIDAYLDTLANHEISSLTTPKFGRLATGNESKSNEYNGIWFTHRFGDCFSKTSKGLIHIGRKKDSLDGTMQPVSDDKASKHLIYVFPDIKSTNNWHKRLISALIKVQGNDYNGYAYISHKDHDVVINTLDNTIDISDCQFCEVKSLKLPKLEKDTVDTNTYLVYDNYGCKSYYSADGLDEQVKKNSFKDQDIDDDWYLEVKSMQELHFRTVGKASDHGTRGEFWTVNSNKIIENLKELGWITPTSPEYIEIKKKFDEVYRIKRLVANAKYNLERIYFGAEAPKRIVKLIEKKPDRIEKLDKIKSTILMEKSTRGRILKSIKDYDKHITRKDLRKILLMKD
jgi:hypothetical protein